MSLLWRDQVRLVLCPDRVVAVRLARGLRTRVIAQQVVPVEGAHADTQAVLATLAQVLRDPRWHQADAVVLLSSRLASYHLLPWTDAVLDAEEEAVRTRQLVARAHGESAASLELRRSDAGFGQASVASGVDQRLLAGIREAFAGSPLKLRSIQPFLMAAFNQCRHALRRGSHWLAVVESGTLCTALLQGGAWVSLRTHRLGGDWPGELVLALRRQALAHGASEHATSVLVHAAEEADARCPREAGWTFRRMEMPAVPGRDRACRLALAGVA